MVAIRVGIQTGIMVAASIGASTHWEYALVGDSVIIAARLQALPTMLPGFVNDAPCCILVGESTWQRLRGEFRGYLLGNMVLKGKKQKVKVYQIVTDEAETRSLLAAEHNKHVESASDLDPKRIAKRIGRVR